MRPAIAPAVLQPPLAREVQTRYKYMVSISSSRDRRPSSRRAALLILAAVLAGCDRGEIKVYRVAKEEHSPSPALPSGWEELPGDQMRVGNYAISGNNGAKAQMTIVSLPGAAGSELDNVNRWRSQVGLQPISAAELPNQATSIQIADAPARLFEMSGVAPQTKAATRILAALQPHGDAMWFFKMMGDDDLVRGQKNAFIGFLQKYQYLDAGPSGATQPPSQPAASQIPQAGPPARTWKSPPGWEQQQPGPMQDAKFLVAGGKATATVSIFDGPTGGVLANVNRWRTQQLGLPPVDEAGLKPLLSAIDLPDTKANLVDMAGSNQRMIAAIVPRGASTWFFKLVGEEAAVRAEKNAFIDFVKSTK